MDAVWDGAIDPSLFDGLPARATTPPTMASAAAPAAVLERKRKHEDVDPSLGSAPADDVKPRPPPPAPVSNVDASLPPAPQPAQQPPVVERAANAVAGPSSAPLPTQAQQHAGPPSIASAQLQPQRTASRPPSAPATVDARPATQRPATPAVVPPSTPPPTVSSGRADDSVPEWSSQKPDQGTSTGVKRKADASPRPGAAKHSRTAAEDDEDEHATQSEDDDVGEGGVGSEVDELEDSDEEADSVETLLERHRRSIGNKGKAPAAAEASTQNGAPKQFGSVRPVSLLSSPHLAYPLTARPLLPISRSPYPTSSLQTFGVGPIADYCARTIEAYLQQALMSAPRLHTERTARSLIRFIADWAPPPGSYGNFQLRPQLLHQAFLYMLRLKHPLITATNLLKLLQMVVETTALAIAAPIACDGKAVLERALGDLILRSPRAEYERCVPVLKAIWFWDAPASVPALLQTHTLRFTSLAAPVPEDVHLLASLLNFKSLAAYAADFASVYPAIERMRRERTLSTEVGFALDSRIFSRRRIVKDTPHAFGQRSPAKPSAPAPQTFNPSQVSARLPVSAAPGAPPSTQPPASTTAAAPPSAAVPSSARPPPSSAPTPRAAAPSGPAPIPPTVPRPAAGSMPAPGLQPLGHGDRDGVHKPLAAPPAALARAPPAAAPKPPSAPAAGARQQPRPSGATSASSAPPPRPSAPRVEPPKAAPPPPLTQEIKPSGPSPALPIKPSMRKSPIKAASPSPPPPAPFVGASAGASQAAGASHDVIELQDSDSDAAPAVARVRHSNQYEKVLDECVAGGLTLGATAEKVQARARALGNTRSCVDWLLDRKHEWLRRGTNAVDVLVRLTTKDEHAHELPPDQVRRDKLFRQACRRDVLQGIVSADDRRYEDRLPTLRGFMQDGAFRASSVDRHLKEHTKRLRTRKPRTVHHYRALERLLLPVRFFLDGHAEVVLDALVDLRSTESHPACLQILGELIQTFGRP